MSNFYYVIYFRTNANANKNIIGNAFILHSRIKPRSKDKVVSTLLSFFAASQGCGQDLRVLAGFLARYMPQDAIDELSPEPDRNVDDTDDSDDASDDDSE
jgi:hypothetical protein